MLDALSAPHSPSSSRHSSNLEQELDAGVRDSLDYQILRRTLMPDSETPLPGEAAAEISQASQQSNTSSSASTAVVDASAQAASFQQVLEQRELELNVTAKPQPEQVDPLVLDLAGNGFSTRGLGDAVQFDLDADGRSDRISAPSGDDALLALDRNGNGRIDDGSELFGDQNGAANGFAELAKYDDNSDGRIDAQDVVFERLRLLRFTADGQQQVQSLSDAGVSAIELQARDVKQALGAYDQIAQLGQFQFQDGRSGQAADLLLAKH
ncbi:hypothetical protein [Aquipseudomonas ullengensis]|uniref:Hemolysin-type calcium-binding repeat-containing protein n=1 Tax=Aquipseudomonas ullengensis TaxID=2759166 RepID=A0A7W4QD61_9GAMM|nr:hypothetical protein [Pseudomonas ullengensis]MBB2495691.1 hypothetical protein [Pseudomonas ullengensis]